MASILYLLVLLLVFTGIGRLSAPPRERTALRTWTPRDVWCNARRGLTVFGGHGPTYPTPGPTTRPRAGQQD
jgi:hypothetical protein